MVSFNSHFDPKLVSWRVGSTNSDKTKAMALAYVDSRDVMERLDHVVGPANWQCTYPHAGQKTVCNISILVHTEAGLEWVTKSDGAGDSDVEAEKGALSDAFKRAAVKWGIGRYLYDIKSPWVDIEPMGKSWKIKESEKPKLEALLRKEAPIPNINAPGKLETMPENVEGSADLGWTPKEEFDAYDKLMGELVACTTSNELVAWWTNYTEQARGRGLTNQHKAALVEQKNKSKTFFQTSGV